MHLTRKVSFVLAFLTLLSIAASSRAQVPGNPIYVESRNSQFGILNPTTGAYTLIGTTSALIGGLGFGADGKLYGLGLDGNGSLYVINPATAGLSFVGNTGLNTSLGTPGFGFGATSDGTLYADNVGAFYRVNPTTAATTTLGNLGFTTGGGLEGDDQGHLYITGGVSGQSFYQVNRANGQATLIGNSTSGSVDGLADSGGVLYAINTTGSIFSVNTATAASTLTATYNVGTVGLVYAAASAPAPAVPEASITVSLGLLLCLGLGGLVVSARRRKAMSAE